MKTIKIFACAIAALFIASAFAPNTDGTMAAATVNKVKGITDTYVFIACTPTAQYQVLGVVDIKDASCNSQLNEMVLAANKQYPTANGVMLSNNRAVAILLK